MRHFNAQTDVWNFIADLQKLTSLVTRARTKRPIPLRPLAARARGLRTAGRSDSTPCSLSVGSLALGAFDERDTRPPITQRRQTAIWADFVAASETIPAQIAQ